MGLKCVRNRSALYVCGTFTVCLQCVCRCVAVASVWWRVFRDYIGCGALAATAEDEREATPVTYVTNLGEFDIWICILSATWWIAPGTTLGILEGISPRYILRLVFLQSVHCFQKPWGKSNKLEKYASRHYNGVVLVSKNCCHNYT